MVILNGEPVEVETINVTNRKARDDFAERLCKDRPGIERAAVDRELVKIAHNLTSDRAKPNAKGHHTPADLLKNMPKAAVRAAGAMLDAPDLMDRVVKDIASLGVAGEEGLAEMIYLVGISRLLAQPLAAIVQGPTSSGKSYIIKKVACLFPPETILFATQLTPQALFYMEPGSLVHRFVVVGERPRAQDDESADATRALREMLSEGRLSKVLPVKVDGQIITKVIEQDGPIAYTESTTLSRVFNEDANRCILLTTDERPRQTRKIIRALASMYDGSVAADTEAIIERHYALQRMLQPHVIVVPYAERLGQALDHNRCEVRRAFPQIISVIQSSALLHQRQRQVDDDGRLLANADDYRLAQRLLAVPMARQLGERVSDGARRFMERLRKWFGEANRSFTVREAIKLEAQSKSSVYGWVKELHDAGLLEKVEAPSGNRAARWQIVSEAASPEAAAVLPSVERVCL
jgi:hypothetical protein